MKNKGRILIVDDEEVAASNLSHVMEKEGYTVTTAFSGIDGLILLQQQSFDLLLTDLRMEKIDGMALLQASRGLHPDSEVIVITGYATTSNAVEAMKQGAFHYIAKPFHFDEVRRVVAEALEKVRLRRENKLLRQEIASYRGKARFITQDAVTMRLLDLARQVAPTDCNVMVTGESGTGKELIVDYIHQHSGRGKGPLIAVNCGAFNSELFANELFGHEREAFTGASTARKGLIEAANGGTLFLDEITEMDFNLQAKLLRVLQERTLERLGSNRTIAIDVRVIAATNRHPRLAISEQKLREDLFYRLNVFTIELPPLRERSEDVIPLARFFLEKYALEFGYVFTGIEADCAACLINYAWSGNVRELENMMERAIVLSGGKVIAIKHLPKEMLGERHTLPAVSVAEVGTLTSQVEALEKNIIEQALLKTGDNKAKAAQLLEISERSLWYKIKKYF